MVFRALRAFFDWQGRFFLGERRWSFAGPLAKAELCQRISSRIEPMRRWRVYFPVEFGRRITKVRGLITDDALFLTPPPHLGVIGTLLGLHTLFQFAGRLTEVPMGIEITGRYRVVPLFRGFMFVWLTGVWFGVALSVGLLLWLVVVGDYERALGSFLIGAVCFGLLGIVYLFGKVIAWAAKPSREALHGFLAGLSEAKPGGQSGEPRA